MIQTYRDPKTKKIYTEDGKHIPSMEDYQARVKANEISGQPKDLHKAGKDLTDKLSAKVKERVAAQTPATPDTTITPGIKRTDDGGIETKSSLADMVGDLPTYMNNATFMDAANQILKMRKTITHPQIVDSKAYWRTMLTDTTPFGGQRDPATKYPGFFSDERMREMSPADQASIRAARASAAKAHLGAIEEEERFMQGNIADILNSLANVLQEQHRLNQEEADNTLELLNILQRKRELGLPITDDDYAKLGIITERGNLGGTITWRNNNPFNIRYTDENIELLKKAGFDIKEGASLKDDDPRISFYSMEEGERAFKFLLEEYEKEAVKKGLPVMDTAIDKLTGGKYTYNDLIKHGALPRSLPYSMFTENDWDNFFSAIEAAEGIPWQEGTRLGENFEGTMNLIQSGDVKPGTNNYLKLDAAKLLNADRETQLEFLFPGQNNLYKDNETEELITPLEWAKREARELLEAGYSREQVLHEILSQSDGDVSISGANNAIDVAFQELPREAINPEDVLNDIVISFYNSNFREDKGKYLYTEEEAEDVIRRMLMEKLGDHRLVLKDGKYYLSEYWEEIVQLAIEILYHQPDDGRSNPRKWWDHFFVKPFQQ